MSCLQCQNCYSHDYANTFAHQSYLKYRCKKKGHREIDQIPEGEKGKGKCSEFTALSKK